MSSPRPLLETALAAFDEENGRDPRTQRVDGIDHPRERIFARRVYAWMLRLDPSAPEPARLAAQSHTLRRWEIPRGRYPKDTAGYHAWRRATARHSAEAAARILRGIGYPEEMILQVSRLISGERYPKDPDARLIEDADCLAFFEIKLKDYLDRWDPRKIERILKGTWAKMTPSAQQMARGLPLDPRVKKILDRLTRSDGPRG